MDKREAIRLFIRRNPAIFQMDPFPDEAFKSLKRDFFVDSAKVGVPRDSEIAGEIVESLIKSSQIGTEKELEETLGLPFLRKRIRNRPYYFERLRLKTQEKEPILDVSKLEDAEHIAEVKEKLREEARQEIIESKETEIERLDKRIQAKRVEYLSVPSILDVAEYPVPEVPEKDEVLDLDEGYLPWWDRLGLRDDPFYECEGLSQISRTMYDQIVHKTEIFNKYEQWIEKSPRELFKKTVFFGQFGSGKTTFFDYINPKLYEHKIYPIYVQLGGEFEVRELIFDFRKKMHSELSRLHTVLLGRGPDSLGKLDDNEAIIALLKKLANCGAKGFVVFIDDLHKGELDKAMRFMSYLQVLTAEIVRETPDLKIGFFVAGSPEWERRMAHDLKFQGSVAREEHMPVLKLEVALDALNRRFKAFAKNPENPREIEKLFLEKIYKKLQYSGQDITFRKVIREMINEFDAGHFDPLSVDPVKIPVSTLNEIKLKIEQNLIIKRRFDKLIYGRRNLKSSQKKRCLELLVSVYIGGGIPDFDVREDEAPFLQQLAQIGLIEKTIKEDRVIWRIPQDLWYANKQIIQKYNLSLEDYLLKIYYAEQLKERRKVRILGPEIEYLDALISSMKKDLVRDLLSNVKTLHIAIIKTGDKYLSIEKDSVDIINKCISSLAQLTKAYQVYEKVPISRDSTDLGRLSYWRDFWWSPEIIQQFTRACSEVDDVRRTAPHVVSLYREAFAQLFGFFREEFEKSHQFHIPLSNLKNNEIKLFHECRDHWRENQYRELSRKLTRYIEEKLRCFLSDIFTVLYGDFDQRLKMLDKDSRTYVLKNIAQEKSKGFLVPLNEFKQLNRGQYKNLMTGVHGSPDGRRNWNFIFSVVFRQWGENDLYNYLDMFAEINTKVSHLKDDSIDPSQQDFVYDFMQKSLRFMMSVNQAYLSLMSSECFEFEEPSTAYFSLSKFKDKPALTPILLKRKDAATIEEIVLGKDRFRIPLDDQEYIEGFTGLGYRKACAIFALLHTQSDEQRKKTKLELEVLKSNGCEVVACLRKL